MFKATRFKRERLQLDKLRRMEMRCVTVTVTVKAECCLDVPCHSRKQQTTSDLMLRQHRFIVLSFFSTWRNDVARSVCRIAYKYIYALSCPDLIHHCQVGRDHRYDIVFDLLKTACLQFVAVVMCDGCRMDRHHILHPLSI